MTKKKFRLFNVDEQKYVSERFFIMNDGTVYVNNYKKPGFVLPKFNYIVEEAIGIKDNTGNEIFENDILKIYKFDKPTYAKVVYCANNYGKYPAFDLEGWNENTEYLQSNGLQAVLHSFNVVIVGNAHQSAELLEV